MAVSAVFEKRICRWCLRLQLPNGDDDLQVKRLFNSFAALQATARLEADS
jgi:hypothetical protein